GLKADWDFYGMKARTNIDYYYGWYDQIQVSEPVVASSGQTVTLVTNAASADIDGVEFEGTLLPFPGLELTGRYSYNHSSYNSYLTLTGDYSGEPFLYQPKNKYTLMGRYHLPIDESWGDISIFANYNWQGHAYLALDATYVQGAYALYTTSGYVADIYGEPRMWGFKVKYHFGGPSEEPAAAAP